MPQRVDPAIRREEVADAVIDEIAEHGLRSVTLARIATRTGLAIGSIRYYFEDTLREVMRFTLSVLMQRIERRATTMSDDPVERITGAIAFAAPTNDQERREHAAFVEYRVMARTQPELAADLASNSRQATDLFRALLRDAMTDRTIDEDSLNREALLLATLVEGFSFSSTQLATPLRETDVRTIVKTTLHRMLDAYPYSEETARSQ